MFLNESIHVQVVYISEYSSLYPVFVAREYPHIFHSLDVWHKAKKIKKALEEVMHIYIYVYMLVVCSRTYLSCFQAGRGKGMGKLSMWSEKIVNHFWYCCQACGESLEMLKVQYIHVYM